MKRIVAWFIVIVLLFLIPVSMADVTPLICDEAELLTAEEENELYQVMMPICVYCTPVFWTTDDPNHTDTGSEARTFLETRVSETEAVIFVIDMANRMIYIYSGNPVYQIITTDVACTITDHTYIFATNGDYAGCAKQTFMEIFDVLSRNSAEESEFWYCENCNNIASGNFCSICGQARLSGSWICPTCGNKATDNFCNICGTQRPGLTNEKEKEVLPVSTPVPTQEPQSEQAPDSAQENPDSGSSGGERYTVVLDHYETQTVERTRRVLDHYETYYTYEDNGEGVFVEVAHQRPVYTEEAYTEEVQVPVYKRVKVE